MLEFKIIGTLKPNIKILDSFNDYTCKIKHLLNTNLEVIWPTEYIIKYYITIIEYKVNEISNKHLILKNIIKNIISKKLCEY